LPLADADAPECANPTGRDSNFLIADCRRFYASSSQAIFQAAIGGVRRY
jgi:hypothetical protein